MENNAAEGNRIQGLADFISAQDLNSLPPIEKWCPPYCGDIGLAIKADGAWYYQGSPIKRQSMVKLFARILRRDPDGKHYLVTPVEKVDVNVADAPFLAVEMQVEGSGPEQQLIFRTNVDDIVYCGVDNPLRFAEDEASGGFKPYVRVRGHLDALLTRAICYDLVELAHYDNNNEGSLSIWSRGVRFALTAL